MEAASSIGEARLRAEQFATAMQSEAPKMHWSQDLIVHHLSESPTLRAVAGSVVVVALLLIVRPPFILSFHFDSKRPWRASCRVSWIAVIFVTLIAAAAVAVAPKIC